MGGVVRTKWLRKSWRTVYSHVWAAYDAMKRSNGNYHDVMYDTKESIGSKIGRKGIPRDL